jgi:hypothetical protein
MYYIEESYFNPSLCFVRTSRPVVSTLVTCPVSAFGIGLLLLMMVVKALLTSTSFPTGFEGGPVFPYCSLVAYWAWLSQILTFIPQGMAVTAGMAGVACAVFPLPLTIALLLGLLGGQPDLLPVIVIEAVIALTPLLPKRVLAGS